MTCERSSETGFSEPPRVGDRTITYRSDHQAQIPTDGPERKYCCRREWRELALGNSNSIEQHGFNTHHNPHS